MEIEDVIEEQRKELQTKLEYSDKNCRMLEIKVKSHQDQSKKRCVVRCI